MPLYLRIAQQAKHLHALGLSKAAIARHLEVDDKTVAKAIAYFRGNKRRG